MAHKNNRHGRRRLKNRGGERLNEWRLLNRYGMIKSEGNTTCKETDRQYMCVEGSNKKENEKNIKLTAVSSDVQEDGKADHGVFKIKQEELILEDYDEIQPSTHFKTCENVASESENGKKQVITSIETVKVKQEMPDTPFETVFCGEIQVKQEIPDEHDVFEEMDESSLSSPCVETVLSDEPLSNIEPLNEESSKTKSKRPCKNYGVSRKKQKPSEIYNEPSSGLTLSAEQCVKKYKGVSKSSADSDEQLIASNQLRALSSSSQRPKTKDEGPIHGVYISLVRIPLENREAAKNKILDLVEFIDEECVHPSQVKFSIIKSLD